MKQQQHKMQRTYYKNKIYVENLCFTTHLNGNQQITVSEPF